MALSSDDRVYGWGGNYNGQIVSKLRNKYVLTPIEIDFNEKINFINWDEYKSCVDSSDGNAYYWGELHK